MHTFTTGVREDEEGREREGGGWRQSVLSFVPFHSIFSPRRPKMDPSQVGKNLLHSDSPEKAVCACVTCVLAYGHAGETVGVVGGGVGASQNEIYGDLKERLRFYAVQYVYSKIKQRTLLRCSPNLKAFTSPLFSSSFCLIVFPPRPLEHLLHAVTVTIYTKCLLCQWCQVEWWCS